MKEKNIIEEIRQILTTKKDCEKKQKTEKIVISGKEYTLQLKPYYQHTTIPTRWDVELISKQAPFLFPPELNFRDEKFWDYNKALKYFNELIKNHKRNT